MQFLKKHRFSFICLLLGAATLALYWPVGENDFIAFDDPLYVTKNLHTLAGFSWPGVAWAFRTFDACGWQPLTFILHMIDCSLFGLNPAGHHLTNVLLHIANVMLLFLLLQRMTGAFWRSAFVAALFAWHPLHVESVAWIAELKDVLSTFFWLLATMAYVRYAAKGGWIRYGAALFLFTLGLMSKPMVVTLPCALLLLDFWPLGRIRFNENAENTAPPEFPAVSFKRLILEKLPFFALALGSCLLTVLAQQKAMSGLSATPIYLRIINALVSYARYIGNTFWPSDLAVIYPYVYRWSLAMILVSVILIIGVTLFVIFRLRRNPWLAVGWFWFLGTLVPAIGLVQVGPQAMADRYMYIPSIGFFIFLAWGLHDIGRMWPATRNVLTGVCLALLPFCLVSASLQIRLWQNDGSLFTHAISVTKGNWLAYCCLGEYLQKNGAPSKALSAYESSIKICSIYPISQYNMGTLLMGEGQLDKAIVYFSRACEINPRFTPAHSGLGKILWKQGKLDPAEKHLRRATELDPNDATVFYELGTCFLEQSKLDDALAAFSEALRLEPDFSKAHANIAVAFMKKGNPKEGLRHFTQAVQLSPEDDGTHYNLGSALLNHGYPAEAEKQFLQALQLSPTNSNYSQMAQKAHEKAAEKDK